MLCTILFFIDIFPFGFQFTCKVYEYAHMTIESTSNGIYTIPYTYIYLYNYGVACINLKSHLLSKVNLKEQNSTFVCILHYSRYLMCTHYTLHVP